MVASNRDAANSDDISVVRVPDTARFAILVNGEPAGFAAYVDDRGDDHDRRIFFHTVIEDGFTGRGLAGRLVGEALAQTVAEGLRIVPVCPYVAKYVTTHHPVTDTAGGTAGDAVADAIDPVTPEALDAVSEAAAKQGRRDVSASDAAANQGRRDVSASDAAANQGRRDGVAGPMSGARSEQFNTAGPMSGAPSEQSGTVRAVAEES